MIASSAITAVKALSTVSTSTEVMSLVRRLADELERVVAPKALASGQRQEMSRILSIADGIRRALEVAEERASAATSRSAESVSGVLPATGPIAPAHGGGTARDEEGSDMEYFRSKAADSLIRRGQVGTPKEYQQRVPRATVEAIVARMVQTAHGNHGGFDFQAIVNAMGSSTKGYQIRIVLSWLRDRGLIQEPTRGHYHAPDGSLVEQAMLALDELPVGSRRRRSKRRPPKSTRRRTAVGG
jgi:hypothetical protein